jgi:hypothetical protein
MNKKQIIGIILLATVLLIAIPIFYFTYINENSLSVSEVISQLKAIYPEFSNYPNNNLPPQSIQTKQASNGWYVAFVQEGSGRPILEVKCFLVTNDKIITNIGEYMPKIGEDRYDLSGQNIFNLWIK